MQLHLVMFRSLWAYRAFVFSAVRREFESRYLGSVLGGFWAVINPLSMIAVYTLVFSSVMGSRLPNAAGGAFGYSVYLCSALLPWGWFAELLGRLNTVFIDNGNLIKKANFPRICLPTIAVLSSAIHFAIIFFLFVIFLALTGNLPGLAIVALPIVLAIQITLALGLGLFLGTLNVFFRDVGQFTGVLLQFWLWFAPIIYVASALPNRVEHVLAFNPITPLVQSYHAIFVENAFPNWVTLIYPAITSIVSLALGGYTFVHLSSEVVDEL